VDAALPGPGEELVAEQLVPQRLDGGDLREEPVPADVEAVAVGDDGAADAADHVVGLQDCARPARLGELIRRSQARGPRTDHDDVAGIGGIALGGLSVHDVPLRSPTSTNGRRRCGRRARAR
jgi:hypothetical protein